MEFPLQRHWQPVRSVTGWWCNGRSGTKGLFQKGIYVQPSNALLKNVKGTELNSHRFLQELILKIWNKNSLLCLTMERVEHKYSFLPIVWFCPTSLEYLAAISQFEMVAPVAGVLNYQAPVQKKHQPSCGNIQCVGPINLFKVIVGKKHFRCWDWCAEIRSRRSGFSWRYAKSTLLAFLARCVE